jgi:16S rRNA C967 or C1407 C5-methylase (RsmB/RsmF family)/NOL1/NOP2/fmu family ribosome biogenesis protein
MLKLPEFFVTRMTSHLGADAVPFFEALDKDPPVSLRLNPFKPSSVFDGHELVPWCEKGRYLQERISFTLDPLFHAGCYYVQEASSMYLECVINKHLNTESPLRVLDLCAAPGGKSTHLLSLIPEGSLLVSNEPIPSRNNILRDNLSKWGLANVVVVQNQAKDFQSLTHYFDVVLVDAPCSGEGLFRKNHEAVNEWSEENLAMCSHRQQNILEEILHCLKPGGLLIYSTCTFNPAENDEVCSVLEKNELVELLKLDALHGAVTTKCGLQMYPHKVQGEGFYLAAMRKISDGQEPMTMKRPKQKPVSLKSIGSWLKNADKFQLESNKDLFFAIPNHICDDIAILRSHLFVRKAGIFMGSLTGDDLIPSQELAMFVGRADQLPSIELPLEEALRYLRGEALPNGNQVKGWCIANYNGHALGWMKGVGNRFNNSYPKELRIRNL